MAGMKGTFSSAALAALVCAMLCGGVAGAAEGEYRNYLNTATGMGPVKLRLAIETRSMGAMDDVRYVSAALGAEYPMGSHLLLSGYHSGVKTKSAGEWSLEQRPYVDATLRTRLGQVELSDRSRMEVRVRDGESSLRYRNRARIQVAFGTGGTRASADGELFYDLDHTEVNTTRVTVGLDRKFTALLRVGASYVYESRLKSDEWSSIHALGLTLSVDL
jgi:hypothetical protein